MIILFTGHRDKICDLRHLSGIYKAFPEATWMCGAAKGVDQDVMLYASTLNIPMRLVYPDYDKYPGKYAPLVRDTAMVDMADLVVCFYDGRNHGGTLYTMNYAKDVGKKVLVFIPIDPPKKESRSYEDR